MKEKKDKAKNLPNVDTSELLKALKRTHSEEKAESETEVGSAIEVQGEEQVEEPTVSHLAASAAAFAKAFSDSGPEPKESLKKEDYSESAEAKETQALQDAQTDESAEARTENAEEEAEAETEEQVAAPAAADLDPDPMPTLGLTFKETDEIFVESPVNYLEAAEPHIPERDSGGFNELAVGHAEQELLGSDERAESAFEVADADKIPSELADTEAKSVIESILFASSQPVTLSVLKALFEETNIDSEKLTHILMTLQTDYAGGDRGMELAEVAGGYQLRTKLENAPWLKKMVKGRAFKLSGPALEVLSIVAYKQPVIKSEIDQIRGVESSHLLRALMEKSLIRFAGKSELPGKPMLYATTKEFLELFGLRNIRELPTLSEIDELIPEGMGEVSEIEDGETLGTLADKMGLPQGKSYSDSENELLGITEDLAGISTSSEFFEQEKRRERERIDQERAQDLKERRIIGENLSEADSKWLSRYDAKIEALLEASRQQAVEQATKEATEKASDPTTQDVAAATREENVSLKHSPQDEVSKAADEPSKFYGQDAHVESSNEADA